MTSRNEQLDVLVDEMLRDAGQTGDAKLRSALLSLGSLASLPAPEPSGELAKLLAGAGAPADELARRRRRRPFHRPTALGLALLVGMGTGVGGVAASSAPAQGPGSRSVQDMLAGWTPTWSVPAQAQGRWFLDPALARGAEIPADPMPSAEPETGGAETPAPSADELPGAAQPPSGLPGPGSDVPPQAPVADSSEGNGQGVAQGEDRAARDAQEPAVGAGQSADPAATAGGERAEGGHDADGAAEEQGQARGLGPASRPASDGVAGARAEAWLQKFKR